MTTQPQTPAPLGTVTGPKGSKRRARTDLYQSVTDKIIDELEAGHTPWVQPWGKPGVTTPLGLPINGHTGRAYSGINILLLWGAAIETRQRSQRWLTFKQAQTLGGTVRKGEHGTVIVYADRFTPKDELTRAANEGGEARQVAFLKRYRVFNINQCDGLPDALFETHAPLPMCETLPRAEALITASGADFRIGGERAFYHPAEDFVRVPPQPAFFDQINYYRTCLHELGHWTGHSSRLDRDMKNSFGSKDYAREELVAELCAAFTCAALSITPTIRHADYIGSWLDVLREDKRAIFRAASLASKAASFLLAFDGQAQA